MKNLIYFLFLFLASLNATAQGEANNWYFGDGAGIRFLNNGSVVPLDGSAMETNEGCSTISDVNGNLLFYTDGRNVWDRNHIKMPNGDYNAGTGLLGDPSSSQSGLIIPNKNNPNIYYIITVDEPHHENAAVFPGQFTGTYTDAAGGTVPDADDGFNNGVNYSIVDLSIIGPNGSTGDVITRNTPLVTYDAALIDEIKYKCSEKITAVKANTANGYWVITQFINKFYSFYVDDTGVNATPVITEIDPIVTTSGYRRNAIGYLKASPDGKKIAIAHMQRGGTPGGEATNGAVYLYDFDDATGVVSNAVVISTNTAPYGIEFSAEAKKLYVSYDAVPQQGSNLSQYDLLSGDVAASRIIIASTSQSGALQLGPNGKIYRARAQSPSIDVINNPEETGNLCNFQTGGQDAAAANGATCSLGLPQFITSFFRASLTVESTCLGELTQFMLDVNDVVDSISWDFGDGTPLFTQQNPGQLTTTHQYQSAGNFTVTATLTIGTEVRIINGNVIISAVPVANIPVNIAVCDPENDGTATFDFTNTTQQITGTQNAAQYSVSYYTSQADADVGSQPVGVNNYVNTSDPQTLFARIQNNDNAACYATTSFEVSTLATPDIITEDTATVCQNGSSQIVLDAGIVGTSGGYSYLWSTGKTTPLVTVNQPGTYTVTVSNGTCDKVRTITVTASDTAVISSVIVNDITLSNTVTINVIPAVNVATTFLYSLDMPNGPFQPSNLFENVSPGFHTVYVSDNNNCGTVSQDISVISVPRFFTPNGDSVNETWDINGINPNFYQDSKILIFDRYGKLLADLDPTGPGWDGTYNGQVLPATDYWYVITFSSGRIVKGHFALIR